MALCWVRAGQCGQETSIEARKVDVTHIAFEITTTCEHIQALAEALGQVDVGHEMSCGLEETRVYTLAAEHVCRNSCIVPAAILKVMEVTAGIFLPGDCQIEFVQSTL
jgi:hypothetical protein